VRGEGALLPDSVRSDGTAHARKYRETGSAAPSWPTINSTDKIYYVKNWQIQTIAPGVHAPCRAMERLTDA